MAKKKQPTKKIHPVSAPRIKDPNKVSAGKARAKKAIRINGKYASKKFVEKIETEADENGYKSPMKYFLENEMRLVAEAEAMEALNVSVSMNFDQLKKAVKDYSGKFYRNGREVKQVTLLKYLYEFNQYLKVEESAVTFYMMPEISMNKGKININMPSLADLRKRTDNGEEITDILDEEDITLIVSDKKKK